jgi:hypothetical protein
MPTNWNLLSDELQLVLSQEALRRAGEIIAGQAEILAGEIEHGYLVDRGGAEALRLLAGVVRVTAAEGLGQMGHA